MAAGYTLSSSDLAIQVMKITNYWKALLAATNTYLTRIADVGNAAISAAYFSGDPTNYAQDLIDMANANTAMSNVIDYASYVGTTSKTDNTGGAGISPASTLQVTPQGTPGAVTDFYQVICHTLNGTTPGSTATPTTGSPGTGVVFTTTGPTTKSATAYNLLTNYGVLGATLYDILWWSGSAWQLVASTTQTAFADTGQARSAYSVPTTNTTAGSAQSVSIPNGSYCVVTADPILIAVLKPVGTDQTPAIRKPSDLTAGQI